MAESPRAALKLYDELTLLRTVPASAWRDCARRLRSAASVVPPAFAAKYADRAVDCLARATLDEAQPIATRLFVNDITALNAAFAAAEVVS